MKKSKNYLLLLFCLFIISVNNGHSQLKVNNRASPYVLLIGTNKVPVDYIAIKDSSADNKMIYTVLFNLTLVATDELKAILGELQSSFINNKPVSLIIASVNFDLKEVEERVYPAANVETMGLNELDDVVKNEAKIRVKIRASVLQIRPGSGKKMLLFENRKAAVALMYNFKFQLGQLPCKGLASTSFLNFTSDGKPVDFTFEFSLSDEKEWHDWLMEASTGSQKKLDGSLVLLGPDLSTHLFDIKLKDVEMTSYYEKVDLDPILKMKISLRAGNISMVLPDKL